MVKTPSRSVTSKSQFVGVTDIHQKRTPAQHRVFPRWRTKIVERTVFPEDQFQASKQSKQSANSATLDNNNNNNNKSKNQRLPGWETLWAAFEKPPSLTQTEFETENHVIQQVLY
jgi:hypothetical protein